MSEIRTINGIPLVDTSLSSTGTMLMTRCYESGACLWLINDADTSGWRWVASSFQKDGLGVSACKDNERWFTPGDALQAARSHHTGLFRDAYVNPATDTFAVAPKKAE